MVNDRSSGWLSGKNPLGHLIGFPLEPVVRPSDRELGLDAAYRGREDIDPVERVPID